MSAKVSISIQVDPPLAAKLDDAISAAQFGKIERITRSSIVRQALENFLAAQPARSRRSRTRATVAPSAV